MVNSVKVVFAGILKRINKFVTLFEITTGEFCAILSLKSG